MSTSAPDLARAAIAALEDALKSAGLSASPHTMLSLLTNAMEERAGTLTVTIATPDGTPGPLEDAVKDALEKKTGKTVTVIAQKDPTLLGGAVISYGDERIDLSARRALEDAELLLLSRNS